MTPDSFLIFFNGIYCDYDGAFGDQCFDLANNYSRWIGGPRFTGATADLIYRQAGDFYTQIPNNPDNYPSKGDIVVWDWPHVGIATGNNTDVNQFEVLEQNDPTDSNCHIKVYNYSSHVLGWLHPKNVATEQQTSSQTQSVPITGDQTQVDLGPSIGVQEIQAIRSHWLNDQTTISKLQSENQQLNQTVNELTTKNQEQTTTIEDLEVDITKLQEQINNQTTTTDPSPVSPEMPSIPSDNPPSSITNQPAKTV